LGFYCTTDRVIRDTRRPNKSRYPDREATDENVQIQLSIAIIANDIHIVQKILLSGQASVNSENSIFGHPLHLAARFGCYDIAALLLHHGAHVTMIQLQEFPSEEKAA